MRWSALLAGLGAAATAAIGIAAWGGGAFWPCETLVRMSGSGRCTRILALEDRNLQGMDRLPGGTILAGTRGHGPNPDGPLTLMEIDSARRAIVAYTPISERNGSAPASGGLSARTSLAQVAVNRDGSLAALTAIGMKTTVVDRQGRVKAVLDRVLPAFIAFDPQDRLLVEMGRNTTGIPDVESAEVFDLSDPAAEPTGLTGMPPPAMFAAGVQTALSGDGSFYAQGVPVNQDAGVAGIHIGAMRDRGAVGAVLATRLRAGCSYGLPRLAFSPDGRKLAAAFACPPRFGTESSALLIWDLVERRTLARIPTGNGWSQPLWLDASTVLVSRYDPDRRRSELFGIRAEAN